MAIYVAAVYWRRSFKDKCIMHLGDNESANSWVNKHRSATDTAEEIAIELTLLQRRNNFRILSDHIPGIENKEADLLSREWTSTIRTRKGTTVPTIKINPELYTEGLAKLFS